jgi:hypothetical protein
MADLDQLPSPEPPRRGTVDDERDGAVDAWHALKKERESFGEEAPSGDVAYAPRPNSDAERRKPGRTKR